MGVGNSNRKVMTLGWRLETEQLGYCMETADFCTGSNHYWLETPNPCLYLFLSFFFRMKSKAPEASSDSHCFNPSPVRHGSEQAQSQRGRSVPALQLPRDAGLKGTGSLLGWGSLLNSFGSLLLFLIDSMGLFSGTSTYSRVFYSLCF